MNTKIIKMTLVGIVLSVSGFSNAAIIDSGDITYDTDTNLEWLDLNFSQFMNYSEFLADQGGLLSAGWTLATNLQADDYFYKLVTGTSGTFAPGVSTSPIPWAVGVNIQSLNAMIFQTNTVNDTLRFCARSDSEGSNINGNSCTDTSSMGDDIYYSGLNNMGSMNSMGDRALLLNRTVQVSEPTTFAILSLCIMGVVSRRFRKQ